MNVQNFCYIIYHDKIYRILTGYIGASTTWFTNKNNGAKLVQYIAIYNLRIHRTEVYR